MAVKKKLTVVFDLASMNKEQFDKLISENENIIKQAEKQKKKTKQISSGKKSKIKDVSKSEITGEFLSFQNSQQGLALFVSQFTKGLPLIGPILAVSGFFIDQLLKLDALAKKFVDIADTRISIFVERQQQALIDNNLQQVIYTTTVGGTSPRDSYNSFDSYDRQLKEDGINRDLATTGGID